MTGRLGGCLNREVFKLYYFQNQHSIKLKKKTVEYPVKMSQRTHASTHLACSKYMVMTGKADKEGKHIHTYILACIL